MDDTLEVTLGDGVQISVPSGQSVTLQDVIWNSAGPDGPVARFRFVAPAIARVGGNVDAEQVGQDLLYLCQNIVLAKLAQKGALPPAVVVSIADRAVTFGETLPDATQYFESYRIEGDTCVWELF
jgi:hypothetical protein